MKARLMRGALAASLFAGLFALAAAAAPPPSGGTFAVMNIRTSTGAAQTFTAAGPTGAGGLTSAALAYPGRSVVCVYNQTAHTGSPSVVFSIEMRDPGTASASSPTWISLLSSAAVTTDTTATLQLGPGITSATNLALNQVLPLAIRTKIVNTVASSSVTGTAGCDFSP